MSFIEMFQILFLFLTTRSENSIKVGYPWINFQAILLLKKIIKNDFKIFEYGSGGSSIFFWKRAKETTSIEHVEDWYNILMKIKPENSNNNIILIKPEKDISNEILTDYSNPENYKSSAKEYMNYNFKNYVTYIDRFPDEYFDLISIDGRSRPSCIMHSLSKVKSKGYLLIDNAEREHYFMHYNKENLNGNFEIIGKYFGPGPYNYNFSETIIYQKK
ncbi:MAG: hypothetical protein Q8880_10455 [Bacteroidota bacterium]|nr:hypothetical protein [Bacteroidota bacterium]